MLISGGDDGALAAHCIDLSINCCVVARGKQSLAHAAQITGASRHATPPRVLSSAAFVIRMSVRASVCLSVTLVSHV